ncbi:dynamin family protein [Nonomuraea sp. NPDC059023]|uniref:dynamin family protein n=1 Tax=unclassified Nonomuraea TaxID=2593643 RepID=UPI00367FC5FB
MKPPEHLLVPAVARAGTILRECALQANKTPELSPLADALRTAAARLAEPMRLAVAGQIKRGKSTLVNALLGEQVAVTGREELTFNVNELVHAPRPRLTVHFRDGPARQVAPSEFARWTVRDEAHLADLVRVRKVEYGLPNPFLNDFHLVDTPGLGSVYGRDSANTLATMGVQDPGVLELLGRDPQTLHQESIDELDQADAVLYLFSRDVSNQDVAAVSAFLGDRAGMLTPFKAFGVLSRCDQSWPPVFGDPLAFHPLRDGASQVIDVYRGATDLSRLFYLVVPIAAKVAAGAQAMEERHLAWLRELAAVSAADLAGELGDLREFQDAAGPLLPAYRKELVELLGAWGVHLACGALRDGLDPAALPGHLVEESGVGGLRRLISGHFGNRAGLIKLDQAMIAVRAALASCREGLPPGSAAKTAADEVAKRVERFQRSEHGFAELTALAAHYQGATRLRPAEAEQLLQVTGEKGTSCAARLGFEDDEPVSRMMRRAKERAHQWNTRMNDPLTGRVDRQTAHTMVRSYERIMDRLQVAQRLLDPETC